MARNQGSNLNEEDQEGGENSSNLQQDQNQEQDQGYKGGQSSGEESGSINFNDQDMGSDEGMLEE